MTMRAAAYLRVSSPNQRERGTIESQNRDVPAYIKAMGWRLVRKYEDDGKSASSAAGKLEARHGLLAMLTDAEAGLFDVLVAWDVDRLTRAEDQIERAYIVGRLQRAGVKIASPSMGLQDLDTFAGDMIVSNKAAYAAEWLRQHRARTLAGKITAAKRGYKPGGPTPYGFVFRDRTWTHHPRLAPIVRELFERVAAGQSTIALAAEMERRKVPRPRGGQWTSDRIVHMIHRDTYVGRYTASVKHGLVLEVPPIVDRDLAIVARAMLSSRAKYTGHVTKHPTLLGGIAVCALCRQPIGIGDYTERGAGIVHGIGYRCRSQRRMPKEERCGLPIHHAPRIDPDVWEHFVAYVTSPSVADILLAREAVQPTADPSAAKAELDRVEASQRFLAGQVEAGMLPFEAARDSLARLAQKHEAARVALADAVAAARGIRLASDVDARAELLEILAAEGAVAPIEEQREAVRLLAARVWIRPDAVGIDLNCSVGQADGSSRSIECRPAPRNLVIPVAVPAANLRRSAALRRRVA